MAICQEFAASSTHSRLAKHCAEGGESEATHFWNAAMACMASNGACHLKQSLLVHLNESYICPSSFALPPFLPSKF